MGSFGIHNYATPFGALSPAAFFSQASGYYDYSGFSSRSGLSGFSGFSGVSGFSAFCGAGGIEFLPFKPTITAPLNFERATGQLTIRWREAIPRDPCNDQVSYEIQFTNTLSLDSGWKTIAVDIPFGTTSHTLDVSVIPSTRDAGLRMRAKDYKNLQSEWAYIAQAFEVVNHPPSKTTMLFPIGGEVFDNNILVVWREADIKDIDGHQVFYRLEITDKCVSDSGWLTVPGAELLTEGTTSFEINSFDFPEGSDYGVRVVAVDQFGAETPSDHACSFKIKHQGNFVIDTIPPDGTLLINDGAALAKDTRVKLSLFAADATTGVKDVRFKNEGEDCWGDWDSFVSNKWWDLSSHDGVKRVFVQYRDFANNVSEACDCEIISRVLCDEGNAVDIEVFNNKLYVAFDKDGNLVEYRVLVKQAAQFTEPALTALARLENFLYVATHDPTSNEAVVYKFDGVPREVIALSSAKIETMAPYNSKLYLGLQDGRIIELNGTSTSVSYTAASAITRLRTDGGILYATLQAGGAFLTFDGATWVSNAL